MRLALTTALLTLLSMPAGAQDTALQRTLDSLRLAAGAMGASAAVIFPDGRVWTGVSGEAAAGRPVTPATLFELGSVTKTYTAALVLQLAAERRLSLDDSLARWLPDFPGAATIRVRQLLNHTAGIYDVWRDPRLVPALIQDPARRWRPEETLGFLREPAFAPGSGWGYSSTGYLLLGMIVERAGGAPVHEAVRRRLLGPLGLTATWFEAAESANGEKAHAFVDVNRDGTAEDLTALMPATSFHTASWTAGAMTATAVDAARWMHALHTGPVLDAASRRLLLTLVNRGDGHRHGLGVLVVGPDSAMLSGHLGNSAGFSAAVFHSPPTGITVSLLTNVNGVSMREPARAMLATATRQGQSGGSDRTRR
jgi:D-alanyl-D-alanine carboxypeptidase